MPSRRSASKQRQGRGWGGVFFAAFTGKAALVMTSEGHARLTIHSLIYRVSEATPEEIARVDDRTCRNLKAQAVS